MHLPHPARRGRRTTAVVSGALLALALLAGCADDEPTDADDPASTPASETSDASEPTDAASTGSSSATEDTEIPEETVSVEVFFVGDTPRGPRLFAEQHAVEAGDPVKGAINLLTSGGAKDPDYRSLVPDGSVAPQVNEDNGGYVIDIGDFTERPADMTKAQARLAVQQLVYTVLSVTDGDRDRPFTFHVGHDPEPYLGVPSGVQAAPELDVRGLVNVLSPVEDETVSGSFTAEGLASSFEATVPWEVRDASGAVVVDGFTTAEGWIERLYPWTAKVDVSSLEPGEYTFVAMTDDPSGGEGGGPTEDTKTIVVE
ncbi:hypothetical protein HNR19_001594 [Nocardioides thalensis]|uniref:GerMN domain-containing protein n=1 Tax=Nocardioides thalensis TaxID=1914755 RepID=A0A853C1M6_9ACTN|nr:Gmad2 immunoglobulin-like domain-containing protein [Nocardioides thalensis]NYJ00896.1 hypothetical protein [Nocardioides thalensis]